MPSALVRGAGIAAVALLTTLATTLPAHAVNRTGCGSRSDFLKVHLTGGGELCFANAGEMKVAIYGIQYISTGNNVVRIRYRQAINSTPIEVGVGKWSTFAPLPDPDTLVQAHKIEWIKIH
ncbi:beta/gamma crystallin domain-containing protein [Streptomyces sp. NPDC017949]|uniref:beta/gamma crystallin domain-containing protein n=1 Tax=Streptomyces sp. NPDC017949 TaxID=3365020 RepID=UPI0037B151E3